MELIESFSTTQVETKDCATPNAFTLRAIVRPAPRLCSALGMTEVKDYEAINILTVKKLHFGIALYKK